jgi:ornithine--oxo-acid transaminase
MELTSRYGAANYEPLPVVITGGQGVWVEDIEGKTYLDMLSGYSALNHGHRHPEVIRALKEQADKVTLTSRAFLNEPLAELQEAVARLTGKEKFLPMNTGAEAVETAIKASRRWAYAVKGIPADSAEIIVCRGNFHGRTITTTSCSDTESYKQGFGPLTPGFVHFPFGDAAAVRRAITPHTAAVLLEPIQGEGGIILPPDGYLRELAELCKQERVLLLHDEIQTGLGRTGRRFAGDWEGVVPDVYILGKALGGGVMPVSGIAADREVMDMFEPGSHGSTFGGNPLACAVALAALRVLESERLVENAAQMGAYFMDRLKALRHSDIREIRGRGLFIGIELTVPARPYCERLMELGLLCKETHEHVIRLAPPLVIRQEEIDWAYERLKRVFGDGDSAGANASQIEADKGKGIDAL